MKIRSGSEAAIVQTVNVIDARAKLAELVEQVSMSHQPLVITSKRNRAVLVCEEDWNALNESLHLMSIAGLGESLREGMEAPFKDCSRELDW